MKKRSFAAAVMAAVIFLTSCGGTGTEPEETVSPVYFLTTGETGRSLGYELVTFDGQKELSRRIADVIEAMKNPINENDTSLLINGVELDDVQVFGSTVVVRFSEEYDGMTAIERSLLDAGVTLSLLEIEEISYIRVTGAEFRSVFFRGASSILLDDGDLRLSTFEIEVYPVDRVGGGLFSHRMRIVTEKEELTPFMLLEEMQRGSLGAAAPFEGRMDIRNVTAVGDGGNIRADIYLPADMDLTGRENDVYSIVNSLSSCRGVSTVTVVINGHEPSERGLVGCDGALEPDMTRVSASEEQMS